MLNIYAYDLLDLPRYNVQFVGRLNGPTAVEGLYCNLQLHFFVVEYALLSLNHSQAFLYTKNNEWNHTNIPNSVTEDAQIVLRVS